MSGSAGLIVLAAVLIAWLAGVVWGASMQATAIGKATARCSKSAESDRTHPVFEDKTAEKFQRKRLTASKLIAFWMLGLTTVVSAATLYLMRLCVLRSFMGALYPLSALITLCQAGNAVILAAYYSKSKAENTKGGITYDAALETKAESNIFDTI